PQAAVHRRHPHRARDLAGHRALQHHRKLALDVPVLRHLLGLRAGMHDHGGDRRAHPAEVECPGTGWADGHGRAPFWQERGIERRHRGTPRPGPPIESIATSPPPLPPPMTSPTPPRAAHHPALALAGILLIAASLRAPITVVG